MYDAIKIGDLNTVKSLIAKGTYMNGGKNDNGTPLYNALEKRHLAIAKFLIDKGANMDIKILQDNDEALLHLVSCEGYTAVAEFLIAKGANVNSKDNNMQSY